MVQILSKRYNAKEIEKKWQMKWVDEEVYKFNPDSNREVYSIDTPPPFTSGTLHMGHIYNHVWIDVVARYRRMRGYNVYFPQGFDCHGLPTELKVENELGVRKENREEFLKKCKEWTESAIKRMKEQFDSIGYSTDWNYTYRTMDDSYKKLVQKTLLEFYKKNLLYREKHPIFWCPRCETALAKAEVGHIEKEGRLYYIELPVDSDKITIATTRPEMMPACVAVFVHPEDNRYNKFIGRKATLPIFDRKIPIIADKDVDMEFGTGAVYLCTFGDEQDIEWQKRYNLPVIELIDKKGRLTEKAGKYEGMSIEDARIRIGEDLMEIGSIRRVEEIRHQVTSHTERGSCKAPIELILLEQWFINVKDFLKEIINVAKKMNWYPEYMLQRLVDWSETMNWDWIISRQRVFGTPIPFWTCSCGEIIPAMEKELPIDPRGTERKCPKCGKMAHGENDVCDCWVDSSVTPLVISRWSEDEKFFKKTYPSSLRPQGYEIIRTWAFYTIYRCLILTDRGCFNDLLINGMVAGPDGRKMSKSLGNVIEPEKPLRRYSADTIRQWAAGGTPGDDYPFSWDECEHSQRFLTKLWNVARFIENHLSDFEYDKNRNYELRDVDRWILTKLNRLINLCTEDMDNYRFNVPLDQIRNFVWHELADNYLEMVKHRLYKPEIYGVKSRTAAQYTLRKIMSALIRLLSPFTPHACDELWENLFKRGYASASEWPNMDEEVIDSEAEEVGELLREIIAEIRKYKTENRLHLGYELNEVDIRINPELWDKIERVEEDIRGTGRIKNLRITTDDDIEEFKLEIIQ